MVKIQILGTGCPKCKSLAANAEKAAQNKNIEYVVEKVTDLNDIMSFGVMITPALALDGEVKSAGKVLSTEEIAAFL